MIYNGTWGSPIVNFHTLLIINKYALSYDNSSPFQSLHYFSGFFTVGKFLKCSMLGNAILNTPKNNIRIPEFLQQYVWFSKN